MNFLYKEKDYWFNSYLKDYSRFPTKMLFWRDLCNETTLVFFLEAFFREIYKTKGAGKVVSSIKKVINQKFLVYKTLGVLKKQKIKEIKSTITLANYSTEIREKFHLKRYNKTVFWNLYRANDDFRKDYIALKEKVKTLKNEELAKIELQFETAKLEVLTYCRLFLEEIYQIWLEYMLEATRDNLPETIEKRLTSDLDIIPFVFRGKINQKEIKINPTKRQEMYAKINELAKNWISKASSADVLVQDTTSTTNKTIQ